MKPIVLTFTSFYLPGYRGGGPIRTIANMVERLGDEFDFHIVTMDRDLGDKNSYSDIEADDWNVVGKAKVFYASPATRSFFGLAKLMRETHHDLLYLNSFFDPLFTLRPILVRGLGVSPKCPLIVAPRGEFSTGALRLKSWKKNPFIKLLRLSGFISDVNWHASSGREAEDIFRVFSESLERVTIASNMTMTPDLLQKKELIIDNQINNNEPLEGMLRVCFLSRIVAMKNLDYALEILKHVTVPIDFKIYGPKENLDYWNKCESLIKDLPINIKISYCGSVDHVDVKEVIEASDLFFVPSRGENFGHVFMESLSAGVPILVSDQTPWRDLESKGIGWDVPLNKPEIFSEIIERFSRLNQADMQKIKNNCLNFALEKSYDPSVVEDNRALFIKLLIKNGYYKEI